MLGKPYLGGALAGKTNRLYCAGQYGLVQIIADLVRGQSGVVQISAETLLALYLLILKNIIVKTENNLPSLGT